MTETTTALSASEQFLKDYASDRRLVPLAAMASMQRRRKGYWRPVYRAFAELARTEQDAVLDALGIRLRTRPGQNLVKDLGQKIAADAAERAPWLSEWAGGGLKPLKRAVDKFDGVEMKLSDNGPFKLVRDGVAARVSGADKRSMETLSKLLVNGRAAAAQESIFDVEATRVYAEVILVEQGLENADPAIAIAAEHFAQEPGPVRLGDWALYSLLHVYAVFGEKAVRS